MGSLQVRKGNRRCNTRRVFLSDRELEVLGLIALGLTNQQIADELIISVGTAKWYTGQIYGKLNVSNRTQAVAHARELNLLS